MVASFERDFELMARVVPSFEGDLELMTRMVAALEIELDRVTRVVATIEVCRGVVLGLQAIVDEEETHQWR